MINFFRRKIQNFVSDKKFSEILKGSTWAFGAHVIAAIFGMVNSIIIARLYGPNVLGIVAVLNSFFALATIFTVLGTSTSILRLIPEHLTKYSFTSAFRVYRKTQYFVAIVSLIIGSVIFMSSNFVAAKLFSKPYLQLYFAIGAFFIIFKSLMILNTQAIRSVQSIRLFAFMQLLPSFSKLTILVLITICFYHQNNPVYAMFASIAITALTGIWIMNTIFKKRSKLNDSLHHMAMKDILSISLPMLMTSTMNIVIAQTGVIVLGMFRPEADVGYYAIAVKLATLTSFILNAVNSMAAPKFSELYHSDKIDELFYIAKKSAKLIFWSTAPILSVLIAFGRPILNIVYGNEFVMAYPALIILALGQFVHSASGATGIFMNMTGHQCVFRNIMLISAVANIGLNFLLTPTYGIYGASIATVISLMFWNITTLLYIRNKFGKTTGYFPIPS